MMVIAVAASAQAVFTDRNASPRERAEDLVSRLTLEEKVPLLMRGRT